MIIVFDGLCTFCNGWVNFLLERDQAAQFRFAAVQTAFDAQILAEMAENPSDPTTLVLVDGRRRYTRSDAILRILSAQGGLWRLTNVFFLLPKKFRDICYTAFARRRYRWFGRAQTCSPPDPRWRDRFLA